MRGLNQCLSCGNYFDTLSGKRVEMCLECKHADEESWMLQGDEVYKEPSHLLSLIESSNPDNFESVGYIDYSIYGRTDDTYYFES